MLSLKSVSEGEIKNGYLNLILPQFLSYV